MCQKCGGRGCIYPRPLYFHYGIRSHQLRHTFGTEAARAANGNLLVIKDLMGHQSPTTTMRYTALAGTMTAATVAAMYPDSA